MKIEKRSWKYQNFDFLLKIAICNTLENTRVFSDENFKIEEKILISWKSQNLI